MKNLTLQHLIVGGGVIGTLTLVNIINLIQKKKIKKGSTIKIGIVDKNLNNFPGGVAYSFKNSYFGYFNNPIRLSNLDFIRWVKQEENKQKILNYLGKYGGLSGREWIEENKNIFLKKDSKEFMELYLPRFSYELWLEDLFLKCLYNLKKNKKKVRIIFLEGHVKNIFSKNKLINVESKNLNIQNLSFNKKNLKKIKFKKKKIFIGEISCKTISIGIGIPSPKDLVNTKSKNYINDFYIEGSTKKLIHNIKNNKKNILFIGSMAGFLEPLQELYLMKKKNNLDFKIISIGSNKTIIQKAKLSKIYKNYLPKIFVYQRILKINKSKEILDNLIEEFKIAKKNGYSKYDVWTFILKKKLLQKAYNNLSLAEKSFYNNNIFSKIRKLTRFTNPKFIIAKEKLIKEGNIKLIKNKVTKVKMLKNKFSIKLKQKQKTKFLNNFDLVINVSGPKMITNESDILKSKIIQKNISKNSVLTDKNYQLKRHKNIFLPGVVSYNFNPGRKTIIGAINLNCKKVSKKIISYINL